MATEKKGQSLWGVIIISAIICGMSFWAYTEFSSDYTTLENSSKVSQSLLENQTHVVRAYAQQISDIKTSLKSTEDLLAKAQAENADLKGQLVKLETVNALEQKIADLEQANSQLQQNQEQLHAKLQEALAEQDFKNVDEGRALLAKYKQKINSIKFKIRDFQIQTRNEQIAARKTQDNNLLLIGNNGYMVRNGQNSKANVIWPPVSPDNKNVQIDVTFVK